MSAKQQVSKGKIRVLLNVVSDPAVLIDEKGRFLMVNDEFEKITGLSWKQIAGKCFLEIENIPAESKAVLLENFKKRMQSVPVATYEIYIIDNAGVKKCVEIKGKKVSFNGQPADLVIIHDVTSRKENQQRLKEYAEQMEKLVYAKVREIWKREQQFRSIFEHSIDGVLLTKPDGTILAANPKACQMLGMTEEEIKKAGRDGVVVKNEKLMSALKEREKTGKVTAELTFKRKDGSTFTGEISSALFTDADGTTYSTVIFRDITERKKIEIQLKESEKRYRTLFNEAPLGILLIDEKGRAVEFNEEAHMQLGYTKEEFAKLTISDYEVLETPEETKARMKRIMETGWDKFETKHRTKTGEIRDVINNVQVIELDGKKYFHVITQDITELKRTESALKMERNKLEAVTENIGAGLAIISSDYRILWANRLLKQINVDCEGKTCYSTFNKLTHVCPDCGVKKIFEDGVPMDIHEYTNVDEKGKRFWVELIVTPLKDEAGRVIAALELAVDITERKIMQNRLADYSQKLEKLVEQKTEQLKQAQAQLIKAERLATIGELAAMVGHDMRNPLTSIKNAAFYLKKKGDACPAEHKEEMLNIIDNAIDRANKIVNDLLEYSREIRLEPKPCTPTQLLAEALKALNIPDKIKLIDKTCPEPLLMVDAEKIVRVFVNLIKNAVDAMPNGGILTITSRQKADAVEITFADTGVGIPKEVKAKLFSPLVTTKAQGMGFGLAICKRIIDAHGGEISVESSVGKGTTFTIKLPLKPKSEVGGEKEWQSTLESSLSMTTPTLETR